MFLHILQVIAWCWKRPPRHILGFLGEWVAAWFLRTQGFSIRARNLRVFTGEIDLLVIRNGELYAVEVRTRLSNARTDEIEQTFPLTKRRKCKENTHALSQWIPRSGILSEKLMGLLYVYIRFPSAGFPEIAVFEEDSADEDSS